MFNENLGELMKLLAELDENAEQDGEALPSNSAERASARETLIKGLSATDNPDEVLEGGHAAMAEFSMMMRQWEAMVEDYERRGGDEDGDAG